MTIFAAAEASSSHVILSTRLVTELADARSTLRTTTERSGPAVIVHAGGEVDASNEVTWRHLVSEAGAAAGVPGPLIVDTSGLDFMGCCAFAVLADEAKICRARGVDLRLVSPQPAVARILGACGLSGLVPVHATVEAALSASALEPSAC